MQRKKNWKNTEKQDAMWNSEGEIIMLSDEILEYVTYEEFLDILYGDLDWKETTMFKAAVEFANGTAITDKFSDKDDFNLWVKNAIADFGNIVYIKIL